MKLEIVSDFSSPLYKDIPSEVVILNKGVEVRCLGVFLASRSGILKKMIEEKNQIVIENDNLDNIILLLKGGEVKENDTNIYDFMKFGIQFGIKDMYLKPLFYIKSNLQEDNFFKYLSICKNANNTGKTFKVNEDFYKHHYSFIYNIEITKFKEFLIQHCAKLEPFYDFLLSKHIFSVTVESLASLMAKWEPKILATCVELLQDIDLTYTNPASSLEIFRVMKERLKSHSLDDKTLHQLEFSTISSRFNNSLYLGNILPKDAILKSKPWKDFNNFYEVLALEIFFQGNDFVKMAQIYFHWFKSTGNAEKWEMMSRIPAEIRGIEYTTRLYYKKHGKNPQIYPTKRVELHYRDFDNYYNNRVIDCNTVEFKGNTRGSYAYEYLTIFEDPYGRLKLKYDIGIEGLEKRLLVGNFDYFLLTTTSTSLFQESPHIHECIPVFDIDDIKQVNQATSIRVFSNTAEGCQLPQHYVSQLQAEKQAKIDAEKQKNQVKNTRYNGGCYSSGYRYY